MVDPFVLAQPIPLVGADAGEIVCDLILEQDRALRWRQVPLVLRRGRDEFVDEVLNLEKQRCDDVGVELLPAAVERLLHVLVHRPAVCVERVGEGVSDKLDELERVDIKYMRGSIERATEQGVRYAGSKAVAALPRLVGQRVAV